MRKTLKWGTRIIGLFLLLSACLLWLAYCSPRPSNMTDPAVLAGDGSKVDYCALPKLDGSGLMAADIPKGNTPGCAYEHFPMPILATAQSRSWTARRIFADYGKPSRARLGILNGSSNVAHEPSSRRLVLFTTWAPIAQAAKPQMTQRVRSTLSLVARNTVCAPQPAQLGAMTS